MVCGSKLSLKIEPLSKESMVLYNFKKYCSLLRAEDLLRCDLSVELRRNPLALEWFYSLSFIRLRLQPMPSKLQMPQSACSNLGNHYRSYWI